MIESEVVSLTVRLKRFEPCRSVFCYGDDAPLSPLTLRHARNTRQTVRHLLGGGAADPATGEPSTGSKLYEHLTARLEEGTDAFLNFENDLCKNSMLVLGLASFGSSVSGWGDRDSDHDYKILIKFADHRCNDRRKADKAYARDWTHAFLKMIKATLRGTIVGSEWSPVLTTAAKNALTSDIIRSPGIVVEFEGKTVDLSPVFLDDRHLYDDGWMELQKVVRQSYAMHSVRDQLKRNEALYAKVMDVWREIRKKFKSLGLYGSNFDEQGHVPTKLGGYRIWLLYMEYLSSLHIVRWGRDEFGWTSVQVEDLLPVESDYVIITVMPDLEGFVQFLRRGGPFLDSSWCEVRDQFRWKNKVTGHEEIAQQVLMTRDPFSFRRGGETKFVDWRKWTETLAGV